MDEALIKRIPPHDTDAEKSVIGAMLMNRNAVVTASETLHTEDFYQQQYGVIFEAMKEMYDDDKPIDIVTLHDKLKEKNLPAELSGPDFLRDIVRAVQTSANVASYAEIVREKAILRRLIETAQKIENDCYLEVKDTATIMDETERDIFRVMQQKPVDDYRTKRDIVLDTLERIENASESHSAVTGLASGFTDLDAKTAGFQKSDLILLAARPSMGKTAFALNIVTMLAVRKKIPVAMFSLEMSKEQLMNRILAQESHVDSNNIRTGQLRDEEWMKLVEAAGAISDSTLIIDDTPGITISELRSKARKYKLDADIQIIFIDYLQLMAGNGRTDNRQQEISDISRALKSLARELNIPIVALSQLNRSVEQREDHRPMLSDLRESGAIEQDADVVMFIYRDEYYHHDSEDQGIAEIIVAKQRNGSIGTIKLVWLPQFTQFVNMDDRRRRPEQPA